MMMMMRPVTCRNQKLPRRLTVVSLTGCVIFTFLYVTTHNGRNDPNNEQEKNTNFLLIYVFTGPNRRSHRDAIRSTYGSPEIRKLYNITVLFFIGQPPEDLKTSIDDESTVHQDLIILPVLESYRRLNDKSLEVLRWLYQNVRDATQYFLKTDDDIFVNLFPVINYIRSNMSEHNASFHCAVNWRSPVVRDARIKWFVSDEEFQGKFYCPYCEGNAVLYPKNVLPRFFLAANSSKETVWVEDVNMYGYVRQKAGIDLRDINEHLSKFSDSPENILSNKTWFSHNQKDRMKIWNDVVKGRDEKSDVKGS